MQKALSILFKKGLCIIKSISYNHQILFAIILLSFQGSLEKWCNIGVVSTLFFHVTIDFTSISEIFQVTAVAHEKYFYHANLSS